MITICDVLLSGLELPGGVGLWGGLWAWCMPCTLVQTGMYALPEMEMGSRMLCLPCLLHVFFSLPLKLWHEARPWKEPNAQRKSRCSCRLTVLSLPMRATWMSRARFQETVFRFLLRPAGSEIVSPDLGSLSTDLLGFGAGLKWCKKCVNATF